MAKQSQAPHCSFCGKSKAEANRLMEGPDSVYICDECVLLGAEILAEEGLVSSAASQVTAETGGKLPSPREIVAHLDQYVIGQERAKRVLAVAVYNHYKRIFGRASGRSTDAARITSAEEVELGKSNVLLVGPTGSGKTLLAQTLAKLLDVPFTIADATTLTEAGYVGEDVETILVGLLQSAEWDAERAAHGIIYVDEIDKITRKSGDNPSITRDVSGEGVQQALLKIIEGTVANVPPGPGRKHPQQDFVQLDTSNILFICGGAFANLNDIVRRRTAKRGAMGFVPHDDVLAKPTTGSRPWQKESERPLPDDLTERERELRIRRIEKENRDESELLTQVLPDDLLSFGLIPEFIGRLPVLVSLAALDRRTLMRILTEPKNSVVRQFEQLFALDGVQLEFADEALDAIATEAFLRKTGARGLRSIVENVLLDVMFEIPSRDDIARCLVTRESVMDGASPALFGQKGQPVPLYREELKSAA